MGCQPTLGGSFPSLPPSLPLPLEVGPLFAASESGGALKLPQQAAKRFLVLFEVKILHVVSCCLDQVGQQMMHFCAL